MKDLSMHIMDIVQNSISAAANLIEINIRIRKDLDLYQLDILDNGKGMDEEILLKVTDPFFTTRKTRKVGMGIPLLKMNAERTGGKFRIHSTPGKGTSVLTEFKPEHPDMLPEGDLEGTIVLLCHSNPEIHFIFIYQVEENSYCFDTEEIKEALGDIGISEPIVYPMLKELLKSNLEEIRK